MNLNFYPDVEPTESKTYLISVTRKYRTGTFSFNCIAWYDSDTKVWHKYDGFDDDSIKEPITDKVTGWAEGLSVAV